MLAWAHASNDEWTPEFKGWFKKSAIVDSQKNPLIFYHGTTAEFQAFDTKYVSELGLHFGAARAAGNKSYGEGGKIFPVVLSIQNPLRTRDIRDFAADMSKMSLGSAVAQGMCKRSDEACIRPIMESFLRVKDNKECIKLLGKYGYDGIVYGNDFEDYGYDSVIAFHPNQVRSAITGEYLWKE